MPRPHATPAISCCTSSCLLPVSTSTTLGDSSRFLACSVPPASGSHALRHGVKPSSHHTTSQRVSSKCAFRELRGVEMLLLTLTKTNDETVHKKWGSNCSSHVRSNMFTASATKWSFQQFWTNRTVSSRRHTDTRVRFVRPVDLACARVATSPRTRPTRVTPFRPIAIMQRAQQERFVCRHILKDTSRLRFPPPACLIRAMKLVFRVVSVVFHAASVITCTWLMLKVPAANKRFLLPKQYVNLALAGALASSVNVAVVITTGSLSMVLVCVVPVSGGPHFRSISCPLLEEADTRYVPVADRLAHFLCLPLSCAVCRASSVKDGATPVSPSSFALAL